MFSSNLSAIDRRVPRHTLDVHERT